MYLRLSTFSAEKHIGPSLSRSASVTVSERYMNRVQALMTTPPTHLDPHHEGDDLCRMIIESAKDFAIFTLDLDGNVTSWNSGAELIIGYTEEEILGQDGAVIFTLDDKEQAMPEKEIQEALTKGRAVDERWHLRKDGSKFWADGLMMPLQNHLGLPQGFLKIIRDRTEYRLIKESLQEALNENQRLREILETKKEGNI